MTMGIIRYFAIHTYDVFLILATVQFDFNKCGVLSYNTGLLLKENLLSYSTEVQTMQYARAPPSSGLLQGPTNNMSGRILCVLNVLAVCWYPGLPIFCLWKATYDGSSSEP